MKFNFNVLLFNNLLFQDTLFNSQAQTRGSSDVSRSTSSGSVPKTRKTSSSTTNIVDDLSSIFGGNLLCDFYICPCCLGFTV